MNAVAQKEQQAVRPERVERDFITPGVSLSMSKDGYVLSAEMPGVSKDGLEISLEGNVLTLIGHRTQVETPKGNLLYRESRAADYRRTFELDPSIDGSKISAHMEQGVLTVQLPKAEKVKPRKITVG